MTTTPTASHREVVQAYLDRADAEYARQTAAADHEYTPGAPSIDYVTVDSGARQTWDTGSQRDRREGKGMPSLIPTLALRRLAGLYERGAAKYNRHNWRRGQPISSYVDSLLRHLWLVMDRQEDADGEDHCAAILWNGVGIMWTLAAIAVGALPAELDDRVGQTEVPRA